jgi:hypothetical protein
MRNPPLADAARRGPGVHLHHPRPDTRSSNPQDTYGVYRTDWTPKPAADMIKGLA